MSRKRTSLVIVTALVAAVIGFSSCASSSGSSAAKSEEIVFNTVVSSYIRTWAIEEALQQGSPYWNAGMVQAQYLSDLNIAFALIDGDDKSTIYITQLRPLADGEPMFSNMWDEFAALKKKYPHLKVNISVGGWGAEHFSDMAADAGLKAKFVENVCAWISEHNLDGVDIDWEYPVGPEWGQAIKSRPEDKENYIALLKDLREALDKLGAQTGKRYSLSTAVPASGWFLAANDAKAASDYADALKLMAYDYYGGWSATTGHLSNIMNNPADPAWGGWSTDQAVKLYLDAGVPPEKMQMGLAFYGRAFQGVEPGPNGDGLFQKFQSIPFPETEGFVTWPQIQEMLKEGSGFTRYWDDTAKAPYLYNGDMWITYCDPEQIQLLTDYSKEKKLGGFFSWEYGTDLNAGLLQVLSEKAQ